MKISYADRKTFQRFYQKREPSKLPVKLDPKDFKNSGRRPSGETEERIFYT